MKQREQQQWLLLLLLLSQKSSQGFHNKLLQRNVHANTDGRSPSFHVPRSTTVLSKHCRARSVTQLGASSPSSSSSSSSSRRDDANNRSNSNNRNNGESNQGLSSRRSKDRAISALSRPKSTAALKKKRGKPRHNSFATKEKGGQDLPSSSSSSSSSSSILPPPPPLLSKNNNNDNNNSNRSNSNGSVGNKKNSSSSRKRNYKRAQMKRRKDSNNKNREGTKSSLRRYSLRPQQKKNDTIYSSLLPPPLKSTMGDDIEEEEDLTLGVSSWDDFLGGGSGNDDDQGNVDGDEMDNPPVSRTSTKSQKKRFAGKSQSSGVQLPSIDDLFPSSIASISEKGKVAKKAEDDQAKKSLNGVLPVSDLFFRTSRNPQNEDTQTDNSRQGAGTVPSPDSSSTGTADRGIAEMAKPPPEKKRTGRKMVRRGMEMLVGGRPVNADPPMRSLEIYYNPKADDWASTILLNTREFGPLLSVDNVDKVSEVERGLFCEHFVNAAIKWDICPADLRSIVKDHAVQQEYFRNNQSVQPELSQNAQDVDTEDDIKLFDTEPPLNAKIRTHDEEDEEDGMLTIQVRTRRGSQVDSQTVDVNDLEIDGSAGSASWGNTRAADMDSTSQSQEIVSYEFGGAIFEFDVGLSLDDLQSGDPDYEVLKAILTNGVKIALEDELHGFDIEISHFTADPISKKRTSVSAEFNMKCVQLDHPVDYDDIEKKAVKVMAAFAEAIEGDLGLALADAARQEHRWPKLVRDTFVEECLDEDNEDDDDDGNNDTDDTDDGDSGELRTEDLNWEEREFSFFDGPDGPFGKRTFYPKGDIFLGDGNDGVFYDHSRRSVSKAPYSGKLGPRLLESVIKTAQKRPPRVIAVGDVHGCVDELQDLLRQCDYRPGDLVVFLGDLVCKGPDSTSVVQMAREIGAIGVRGNHDFEVIRWHQAIKSGVDPPVVGSEHYHVASCLSKGDIKWMYSLPWFMSSKDLGALFVHAGFVSGVRLTKQNPRLMMNMRSILPDGTVTSKFFNNWPWARLWDGPQTVLFGHDADRGLQQYEHAIGLDTGCVYGGRLTACILPERRLVSVSARREYFKYRRKKYD